MNAIWRTTTIGDVCEIVNGGTPKTGVAEYWDGPHQWITPAEMGKRTNVYIEKTQRTITDQGLKNSSAELLPPNSVILSSRAPIGHLVINLSQMATNQGCKGLIPKSIIDYKFLFYYMSSIVPLLNNLGTGTTFKELSGGKLRQVPIPLPPLIDQQRIVAILDEAFAGLKAMRANAETNLRNARALFDGALSAAFSARDGNPVELTLAQASIDFGRGKSKHRPRNDPKLYGGTYPFIQTGDVRNCNHTISTFSQTYNDVGLAQSKLWPKGTICITIAANIAETGVLAFEACFPDSVIGIVPDDKITTAKYIEYMLQSFRSRLQAEGKGSAQDNINLGTFENKRFPFPSLSDQMRIAERLDSLNEAVETLSDLCDSKIAAIDELKKSLLHQAFSGNL